MKLSKLADHFAILDKTTSRNALIEELAKLFKESSDPEEIRKIVYLSEGILLPAYEGVEIGISEQLMARAIAEATGERIENIRKLYQKLGDYGLVAEHLIKWDGKGLTVGQAYEALLNIAQITGKGSIEAKVSELASLIKQLSPKEARYLIRIAIGKLRLGIGDPTIIDGLSLAYGENEQLPALLERAYNISGDMGRVAYILYKDGPEKLEKLKVQVGNPIRMELAERAPDVETILKRLGKCSSEPKYDGFRAQIHKSGDIVQIFTRNLENTTKMFPDIIEATRKQINARQAIFEGEAVSYDPETGEFHSFQITVRRKRKHLIEEKEEELPLKLMVFDCLFVDGKEMIDEPYIERRKALQKIVSSNQTIQVTDALISEKPEEITAFFNLMVSSGLEGIIAKSLESPYRAGRRTFDWLKLKRSYQGKLADTVDCVIVGYFAGRGKRAKWGIGSLLCAVYDEKKDKFQTITRVASGLTDEDWVKMKEILDEIVVDEKPARVESLIEPDVWVEPRYVTEILADEITRSPIHTAGRDDSDTGFALRFPRIIKAIRTDRRPEDATTIGEVKNLYETQRQVAMK
ncbi:MAG: ATP-dependent DNA ligase [Armatimonadetes bacterium]|nr:ATP-dependent DNA ligase [Armatimonadota bacterium]